MEMVQAVLQASLKRRIDGAPAKPPRNHPRHTNEEARMSRKMKTMYGNAAAAYISYAFTDVAAIYPITPSTPMAENMDEWTAQHKKTCSVSRYD
ncbi:hypothetical protein [Candidatus Symbiopectobacterium endolongispinus]|uniref:hypothetical protein n=1 Tax=Candidatus Symbiopectobacterium endolongispinus TaxID=2812664 RepID=UPI003F688CC8